MVEECDDNRLCFFIHGPTGQKQERGCVGGPEWDIFWDPELADHDKKCKPTMTRDVTQPSNQVCVCNYDLCNENMDIPTNNNLANPTSLASLTLLASLMLALTI